MKKIDIKENIFLYEFNDNNIKTDFNINITAIVDGNRALIIDTGYEEQARLVKKDLMDNGISVELVVLSHYHPDHISGCKVFKGCSFIGSKLYKYNLERCKVWFPDEEFIEPNILMGEKGGLKFGTHDLSFIHTPGHCKCSISTVIDYEIIHVGDLIMKSHNGKDMIPYISDDGNFKEHIESLNMVAELEYNIVIPSHGEVLYDKKKIKDTIFDRIYYLKKVDQSKGKLALEDCLRQSIENYESLRYHSINIKQLV